jgi:agmatinase
MALELYRPGVFQGSEERIDKANIVIIGAPMDWTATFRPGSRFGPQRIRSVSEVLEEYSIQLKRNLDQVAFYDVGDLVLPFGDVKGSLKIIEEAAAYLYSIDKIPFFLGGEHLVTLPILQAASRSYPDLHILHFDAHADLRSQYMGMEYSHSTVMRRSLEEAEGTKLFQFGIRSGIQEEIEYAKDRVKTYSVDFQDALEETLNEVTGRPVYITLDIDVVDPAYAPGTGTPEPGGTSSRELLEALYLMDTMDLNIVGFDLVEVAPPYDMSDITSVLAARILREMLLIVGRK